MHHNFLPHTDADREAMLKTLGLQSQDQLFDDVPKSIGDDVSYSKLPKEGLSELELQQMLRTHASENRAHTMASFLGGGAYHRFIPPAVNTIAGRAEFYTAYTPYQPEIAQGTLQYTYEFQTMMCELTGMDVANAGVYDGATAVAEAALMALRSTNRDTVLVMRSVHPHYRGVLDTYINALGDVSVIELLSDDVASTFKGFGDMKPACVIVQQPSFFGTLEDIEAIRAFCEQSGALFIVVADPISLGLLKPPGEYGADIVVGDIQPLGNNPAYGGPYGGYVATLSKHLRQLPGRVVGRTRDASGQICYTLTLQTREQHIRRAKATSNICTNQALNVLKSTIYMTLVGPTGLGYVANLSLQRAHALVKKLTAVEGVILMFDRPHFSEFAINLPVPAENFLREMEGAGILAGVPLGKFYREYPNALLVSCTELTTPDQLNRYAEVFEQLLENRPKSERSKSDPGKKPTTKKEKAGVTR